MYYKYVSCAKGIDKILTFYVSLAHKYFWVRYDKNTGFFVVTGSIQLLDY